jgi:hypothetical protein
MFTKLKYLLEKQKLKKYIYGGGRKGAKGKVAVEKLPGSVNAEYADLAVNQEIEHKFATTLLSLIDKKGVSDVECYKRANIDRKLFSKIRSNADYQPSKNTAIAFAIALKCNLQETNELLKSAGYCLSHSFVADIIVEYFINKQNYDIDLINIALDDYGQPPLGAKFVA